MSTYTPDEVTKSELAFRFDYYNLKPAQAGRLMGLRKQLGAMAGLVQAETPPGYEQGQALAKLEECAFWVDAAITRNE